MIIAQITDFHVGYLGPDEKNCQNAERLELVLDAINKLRKKPDLILATGDLVEHGETWAYEMLKSRFANLTIPIHFLMGNHDTREPFQQVFPQAEFNDGFLQYVIEDRSLRIIALDTLDQGNHGGAFCPRRENWLKSELDKAPDTPTLIAMHHPPIESGIPWLTAQRNDPWVVRLRSLLSQYDNIAHIIAGHIHRNIYTKFAGTTISVSEAVAPQVKLELEEIDADNQDGRDLIVRSRPVFNLHQWDGYKVTSHTESAELGETLVQYDEAHAYAVKMTRDEKLEKPITEYPVRLRSKSSQ
ncbi:MAG: phosphodiesterase [Hyphomonadaceae bacterium]|nr:phosphodiesterase [Hyphomonadaceae bacterium]